jgi:hypothetical protein
MEALYRRARLLAIQSFTVDPFHSLRFLSQYDVMKSRIEKFFKTFQADELNGLDQGYLLMTVGIPH